MEWLNILVGFIGVIIGAVITLIGTSRQQEKQAITSQKALRRALLSELKSLSVVFESCVKNLEGILKANKKGENLGAMAVPVSETPVYLACLPQLGRLTELEVAIVIDVYQVILAQDRRAQILPDNKPRGDGVYVPPKNLAPYREFLATVPPEIAKAIRELEKN